MCKQARFFVVILGFAFTATAGGSAAAQGPTRVLFDNGKVRVQEVRFRPGDEGPNIPRPFRVIRVLEGGTMQRLYADGRTEDVVYNTGEVKVYEADKPFVPRNIGKSDIVLYVVALKEPSPDAGGPWTTLIDGAAGLHNWNRVGDANWRAEDGAIAADAGKGGYLVSKNSYADFHIRAEFWADHTTNSGVFFRISDPLKVSSRSAYEVNIYDESPDPSYGTGAIVNVAAVSRMPKAGGRWNTCEITAKGSELTVVLNGVQTVYVQRSRFLRGPIALQYRKGPIKWRKVHIREL